jgi:hypothetical protein
MLYYTYATAAIQNKNNLIFPAEATAASRAFLRRCCKARLGFLKKMKYPCVFEWNKGKCDSAQIGGKATEKKCMVCKKYMPINILKNNARIKKLIDAKKAFEKEIKLFVAENIRIRAEVKKVKNGHKRKHKRRV